jgi:MFS family permease
MGPSGHHVRAILARGDFRRLLTTRVTSQFADGVFQAGLAGSVLFNPDRHTDPVAVAMGFAVLLLPYSLVGPFVGVLLDRWSRRTVLVIANLVRVALIPVVAALVWSGSDDSAFLLLALLIIGVNRFVLAGLSASLPHVTEVDHLATANALSTTSGALAFSTGIGAAVGLGAVLGTDNHGYALVSLASVFGYLTSSAVASGFSRGHLGPDATEREARPTAREVARGMVEGCRHLYARPSAGNALLAITAHRLFFGASTIATLLLYRNYFTDHGFFRTGAVGLGQVFLFSAVGAFIAASVTPAAIRRMSPRFWVISLLVLTSATQLLLGGLYRPEALLPAALLAGLGAQGIKIVVDTTVQYECDDGFQGRVFSVYDTLFNVSFVGGLLFGAFTLPETGRSYVVLALVAAGYAAVGGWYAWASKRWPGRLAAAIHEGHAPGVPVVDQSHKAGA